MHATAETPSAAETPVRGERRSPLLLDADSRVAPGLMGAVMVGVALWQATRSPWRLVLGVFGPPLLARAALGRRVVYRALGLAGDDDEE